MNFIMKLITVLIDLCWREEVTVSTVFFQKQPVEVYEFFWKLQNKNKKAPKRPAHKNNPRANLG